MSYTENMKYITNNLRWQDYRGSKEGVLINFECATSSVLPIRDILNESGKGSQSEPCIETGTYGFFKCIDAKTRNMIVKVKKGYIFFLTSYQGTNKKYKDRNFIVGYYHITQTADLRKNHMRTPSDKMCPELDYCHALRSADLKFVAIEDALELTPDKMKSWGYKGKLIRQLKLNSSPERTAELLAYFADKKDETPNYILEIEKAVEIQKTKEDSEVKETVEAEALIS